MRLSFLKIESYRTGIIFSSLFNLIAKCLVFVQGLFIAQYFGAHAQTDVYFFCYSTALIGALFVNSLDSSVLIPESMRMGVQEGKDASMQFLNFFIYIYLAAGILVTGILYISPVNIALTFSRFDAGTLESARTVLLLSIPLFTLITVTNLLANILASYKFFTMPMVVSAINGTFALLALIFFHEQVGIASILVGTLTSYILNLLLLIYMMKKNLSWSFAIVKVRISKLTIRNIFFAQAGNISTAIANYSPLYLISSFGSGMLTAMTYGLRTAEVPQQIINFQFSAVAGIKFNELNAQKDHGGLNAVFLRSGEFLLALVTPISVFLFLYSDEVISILFKRGEFTQETVYQTGDFLKYFVLLLPFTAIAQYLMSRMFMATQKIAQAFWYHISFNVVMVGVYFVAIEAIGPVGIAITQVFMHVGNFLFNYLLARWFFPFLDYKRIMIALLKIASINAIPGVLIFYFKENLTFGNIFATVFAGGILFVGAVGVLYIVTGVHKVILSNLPFKSRS